MPTLTISPPDIEALIFNVATDKWIPVVYPDGSRDELGLREALATAHAWSLIADPMPTVEFGLYRLLVAFVLDIFEPEDPQDWSQLWDEKQFDASKIDTYFQCHSDAFDLFDAKKPFLQNAGMEGEKAKPLAGLVHPMPSGTGTNLFHHSHEDDFGVSPAVAARLLTTIAPFMTAGGAGLSPSINGAPPWYVLPLGKNGFETLLMNTPIYADSLLAKGDTPVAWRQQGAVKAGEQGQSSLLQAYTWRARMIQLLPDNRGGECALSGEECLVLVSQMKFGPCWSTRFEWTDPNAAYRTGKERTILRSRENREVWRDTGPFALLREESSADRKTKFERPAIVSQLSDLRKDGHIKPDKTLDLLLYGMRSDMKMKIFEWHKERLRIPFNLVWEQLEANEAQDAMELAEDVAYALKRAIKITYPREGKGNDAAFATLADSATRDYWRSLHRDYEQFLNKLARTDSDDAEARRQNRIDWRERLRVQGRKALATAIEDLADDGDVSVIARQNHAYRSFAAALNKLLKT